MSAESMTIIIDGVEVPAKPGQTVLEAADEAGIYIPRLCYHPSLPPGGHCRVCTVKINGRPFNSCTYPVSDGLVVENETDELRAMRTSIIEMLFVEGTHICPYCEASGRCELQALAYRFGLPAKTLPYFDTPRKIDMTHPDAFIDRDRCILCGRCVRASRYADNKSVFGFEGRGAEKRIAVNSKTGLGDTEMNAADKAATICPTGSLLLKKGAYNVPIRQRLYDKKPIGTEIEARREGKG